MAVLLSGSIGAGLRAQTARRNDALIQDLPHRHIDLVLLDDVVASRVYRVSQVLVGSNSVPMSVASLPTLREKAACCRN